MREAASSAAQLPFQVAAGVTDGVVLQAEGLWPGHRDEFPHDTSQLYHENSIQMRHHEQEHSEGAAAIPQGRSHKQVSLTSTLGDQLEKAEEGRGDDPGSSTVLSRGMSQGTSMSSSSDGLDITGSGIHDYKHYRLDKDVVLRLEYISANQTKAGTPGQEAEEIGMADNMLQNFKAVLIFLRSAEVVGNVMLIYEFVKKLTDSNATFRNRSVSIMNVVFGALCWVALTACMLTYLCRWNTARRQGRRWKPRRRKLALLLFTELVVQWINVCSYLVPNINLLARPCAMFSNLVPYCGLVSWTCWNTIFLITVIQAHNVMPYSGSGWSLIGWMALQARKSHSIEKVPERSHTHRGEGNRQRRGRDHQDGVVIDAPWTTHAPKLIIWCCMEASLIAAIVYNLKGERLALVVLFYTYAIVMLWYVRVHSCRSYIYTWYGLLPLQVVESAAAVAWAFFAMPAVHMDDDTPALQVWLQEFSWTEDEKAAKIERRNRDGPTGRQLAKEPMFCFEFAMNMLYWSAFVYDYGEVDRGLTLETAMALYGLEHSELFWEKALDTKLLMAWNSERIVVAFRGTASLPNALADVQVGKPKAKWP
ncbi:hypothetical protein COCOBI_17-3070 [Coccomyxa sp. Obi]|nr:hypothetical protein COCOBI_17-3070 [Coccomyxa sp. Obi]